jgi:hypothetical protein
MPNQKKFDYRVRIQVGAESPDGVLLDCLKHERHPSYSHKEMLLWALRAYWLPIAYQIRQDSDDDCQTDAQLRQIAIHSIHQLKQQIAYLQTLFAIAPEPLETAGAIQRAFAPEKWEGVNGASMLSSSQQSGEAWFESEDLFDSSMPE